MEERILYPHEQIGKEIPFRHELLEKFRDIFKKKVKEAVRPEYPHEKANIHKNNK